MYSSLNFRVALFSGLLKEECKKLAVVGGV